VSTSDLGSQLRSEELVAFLHSGVSGMVGNSDADLVPALTRGFAFRVAAAGESVDVFVGRAQSGPVLARLRPGAAMAITVASPIDYRAVQIKGTVSRWQPAEAADAAWVARHWELFQAAVALVGIPPDQCVRLRCRDLVRITVVPRALFRQTPGPSAGSALEPGTSWG
jgi:hypothetical protein